MKLYTENNNYKIYQGSMLDLLEVIEPNTIDSVVTDPPYELNFMNKGWDRSGIAFQKDTWEQCYKALKPGGYLLAFGGSRTFHRIAVAIEDAGFEIRDVIMWVYGSGFPKSYDISKALDKMMGAEREVVEKTTIRKDDGTNYGLGHSGNLTSNTPSTDEAKQWQGWGTALKPAYEPVIVARKPLKGTVAQNVMQYGVGGINIDECRVGDEYFEITDENYDNGNNVAFGNIKRTPKKYNGRFPANFTHDGSDEVVSLFSHTKSGVAIREKSSGETFGGQGHKRPPMENLGYDDGGGSTSRFFYTAKASKKDRDEGLSIEPRFTASAEFRPNHMEKALEGESGNPYGRWQPRKNIHPTVKPCELMQYLVRLVTPKNGTVLDPFMGSGSTGKATMFENRERNANYKFIGIDLDLDNQYCEIANARIDYALNKFEYDEQEIREQDKAKGQMNIFDFMGEDND